MTELSDPLSAFAMLEADHRRLVSDHFENLVRISGVDETANLATMAELQNLEVGILDAGRSQWKLRSIRALSVLVAIPLGTWAVVVQGAYLLLLLVAIASMVLAFIHTRPHLITLKGIRTDLGARKEAATAVAWAQMERLNGLHTWDVAPTLFQQVIPEVEFDRFLTQPDLDRLHSEFGLQPEVADWLSMLSLQSGKFRENPFVVAKYLHHWMGRHTYFGSLVIHWTERERDSDGNWVNSHRSETLTASVVKPHPCYATANVLLYGHDAVPTLSFSRTSSRLSGLPEGAINDWRKQRAVKSVERKARRSTMTGTGSFTVMANTEFESLFKATDRNDEVGFRLFFTPLAQQNMVKLLNDRAIGFGDDFSFTKIGKLNYLVSKHIEETDLRPDPRRFASMSLSHARQIFHQLHSAYFRAMYFSLAPLWAIPLLTDKAPIAAHPDPEGPSTISTWALEEMANYIGQHVFRHPESVTTNLLKVRTTRPSGKSLLASVEAHGYSGTERIDLIPVRGGDGNFHSVPVRWVDYQPVVQQSTMLADSIVDSDEEARWHTAMSTHRASTTWFQQGSVSATVLPPEPS